MNFSWLVVLAMLSGGDLATTETIMSKANDPGVVSVEELNPFQQNRALRVGLHLAMPVAVHYGTKFFESRGHDKLALIVRICVAVAYSWAIAHNIHQLTRGPS